MRLIRLVFIEITSNVTSPFRFLRSLYGFLDGTADSTKFEDVCRSIGGNKFYLFLTIDKLILKFVKQVKVRMGLIAA